MIARYDVKLIAQNAVRFDIWVVSQKLTPRYHVRSDGTRNPLRETKIVKTSRNKLFIKVFKGPTGKLSKDFTFTSSFCHPNGNIIDKDETFGLQNGLLKDNRGHDLF